MPGHDQSLIGKKVFITGAGSGIGAMTAEALAMRGAVLYLTDVNFLAIERVGRKCRQLAEQAGGQAYWSKLEVTDQHAVQKSVDWAAERMSGIDIVFANAGIAKPVGLVGDVHVADRILDVNLRGTRYTVDAGLPHILRSNGYILVNASMGAIVLLPLMGAAYGASKAAAAALGQTVNLQLKGTGARCGVLYMAEHDTPMEEEFEDEAVKVLFEDNPRLAKAHRKRDPRSAVAAIVRGMEERSSHVHAPLYTMLARWFPAVPNWFVRNYLMQNPQRAIEVLRRRYNPE